MALPKAHRFGLKTWASLALSVWLAGCGGGQGAAPASKPESPPPVLQMNMFGPGQVQAGESVLINGGFKPNGALPASMSWKLLERPAGSQTVLGAAAGSSQQLRTDVPGNYVLQWTATTADGQSQSRQWTVNAVQGPVIQTSTSTGQVVQGTPTTLVAALPARAEGAAPATFRWTLLNAPAGSGARLSSEWGQEVRLTADRPGDYRVAVETKQGADLLRTVRTLSTMTGSEYAIYIIRYCEHMVPDCAAPQGNVTRVEAWSGGFPDSAPVTFRWSVVFAPSGSAIAGTTATGPTYDFAPDVVGLYGLQLDAQLDGTTVATQFQYISVVAAPNGRIDGPSHVKVGQQVTLDSSANRTAYGDTTEGLIHAWRLQKAPAGSSAKLVSTGWPEFQVKFQPDRPGDYVITLQIGTLRHYATFNLHAVATDPGLVYPPRVIGDLGPLIPGEPLSLKVDSESDPTHPLTYTWKLGDGSTLTGENVVHSYAHPGTYQVQVTATNSLTQRFARTVVSIPVVAERFENIPPAPCMSGACGAMGPGTYAGEGIGHWRFTNDRPHQQLANLHIAGVPSSKRVLLSLTNASSLDAGVAELGQLQLQAASNSATRPTELPGSSQDYRVTLTQARNALLKSRDAAHAAHLERDRAVTLSMAAANPARGATAGRRQRLSMPTRAPAVLPAVDTERVWNNTGMGGTVTTRLRNTCVLPDGRAVLFWLEDKALQDLLITKEQIADEFMPVACGEAGGFHRLQKLLGAEVFGSHDLKHVIHDDPLQPIHVILMAGGENDGWGAYVHGVNHYTKAHWNDSNEALLMFVNTRFVKLDLDFLKSSLVHEFMHLINIYQRSQLVNVGPHETWLEETTAMMAEDLLASDLVRKADGTRFAPMAQRLMSLQSNGYPRQYLSGFADYSVGGSLAAYLDRRLGPRLLRGLTLDCDTSKSPMNSAQCLDEQVFRLSGGSLSDSYSAMNVSVRAALNFEDSPLFGMPAYVDGTVDLPAIDLKSLVSTLPESTWGTKDLHPGTDVFQWETMQPSAQGHYRRKGVVVPPGHVLQVLIK